MSRAAKDPRVTYENQSFGMVCDAGVDIPRHDLPAGYRMRPFRPGDDAL